MKFFKIFHKSDNWNFKYPSRLSIEISWVFYIEICWGFAYKFVKIQFRYPSMNLQIFLLISIFYSNIKSFALFQKFIKAFIRYPLRINSETCLGFHWKCVEDFIRNPLCILTEMRYIGISSQFCQQRRMNPSIIFHKNILTNTRQIHRRFPQLSIKSFSRNLSLIFIQIRDSR